VNKHQTAIAPNAIPTVTALRFPGLFTPLSTSCSVPFQQHRAIHQSLDVRCSERFFQDETRWGRIMGFVGLFRAKFGKCAAIASVLGFKILGAGSSFHAPLRVALFYHRYLASIARPGEVPLALIIAIA
jgi:hypothetical protein